MENILKELDPNNSQMEDILKELTKLMNSQAAAPSGEKVTRKARSGFIPPNKD